MSLQRCQSAMVAFYVRLLWHKINLANRKKPCLYYAEIYVKGCYAQQVNTLRHAVFTFWLLPCAKRVPSMRQRRWCSQRVKTRVTSSSHGCAHHFWRHCFVKTWNYWINSDPTWYSYNCCFWSCLFIINHLIPNALAWQARSGAMLGRRSAKQRFKMFQRAK